MSEELDASPATFARPTRRNVNRADHSPPSVPTGQAELSADGLLLERIRAGDLDAGHQFVHDHYPGVYRYLLYLTGSPDAAEDLTQETFLQAWCRLDTFEGRAALQTWLHRIAHREFLQARRSRRLAPDYVPQVGEQGVVSLEAVGEVLEPRATGLAETVELRVIMAKLPTEGRETMVLHYLEGYQHEEIAHILGIPLRRVRQRLSEARARLQQELAEGDLLYLNEPSIPMRQWAWLPLDQMFFLATRLTRGGAADRKAPAPGATMEEPMERREFLRQAAVGAAGLMLTEPEKEVIDSRLTQKVTCAFKGTALSDLCEKLKSDTGIHLAAGPSVADEKVTLFCQKLPLRDVMRQLSRPFGYTWLRSKRASGVGGRGSGTDDPSPTPDPRPPTPQPGYRYELVQDLRSQLLEEELRNRDRNAALLALEQEIERYRPYLDLSPDEALARSKTAAPAEKPLLEKLGGKGWGLIQLYFRLSPPELAQLRSGQPLHFSEGPRPGEQPLPAGVARGVLQSLRDVRLVRFDDGFKGRGGVMDGPGLPPTDVPEARAAVLLELKQSELGQFVLDGGCGVFTVGPFLRNARLLMSDGALAAGTSPVVLKPDNERDNARLAHALAMQRQVTVETGVRGQGSGVSPSGSPLTPDPRPLTPGAKRLTTADVLEALHHATGWPVVADFYTRLYPPEQVSVHDQPLFAALNHLADTMRLRWHQDADWLQFRSASFYDDRLKEVPNRLLSRWSIKRGGGRAS
jgi:RNA polymerase sigma-70 factor, ECF subfamily